MRAWQDVYSTRLSRPAAKAKGRNKESVQGIPIDASSSFRNGTHYRDITEFRKLMLTEANRDRFVRCFITKLLTYANGVEPDNFAEVEKIVRTSAAREYRIVDTIAAVIDSPLFREE